MQSIEHTLRALDKVAEDERRQVERLEKTLTDYQAQANRPFEHEARLKELLARQAQLNAALDLDKSDAQAAEPAVAACYGNSGRGDSVTSGDDLTRTGAEFLKSSAPLADLSGCKLLADSIGYRCFARVIYRFRNSKAERLAR